MSNHVEIISQIQEHSFEEAFYEVSSASHFWFQWRFLALLNQLKSVGVSINDELSVLDVGGGKGVFREQVESATKWNVDLIDLDYKALCSTEAGRGRTMYYDILETREELCETYDVAVLFDVLEHIHDTKPLLQAIIKHIKPNGFLLINVPALESLYSAYDKAVGHIRRYTIDSLKDEFADCNVEIKDTRYWGLTLLPLGYMRKFVVDRYANQSNNVIIEKGFKPPNGLTNNFLKVVMKMEIGLISKPPIGTSVLLAGKKI